jgi:signal peptidase I
MGGNMTMTMFKRKVFGDRFQVSETGAEPLQSPDNSENLGVTSNTPGESPPPLPPSWLQAVMVGRRPRNTFIRIAVLMVASFVIFDFILLPIRVTGISMLPTYRDRSINFVNCLAYAGHEPRRGDVVSIRFAGKHLMLMKRIIALPGEKVGFENGRVVINGNILDEPYEKTSCDWNIPPVQLGADEYFVVGDNRTMLPQDHVFGAVTRDRILGKVLL